MAASQAQVIVFIAGDLDASVLRGAKAVVGKLGSDARVIDKLTCKLDELLLVAHYRVVDVPTWVVVDATGKEVDRHTGVPTPREARVALEAALG